MKLAKLFYPGKTKCSLYSESVYRPLLLLYLCVYTAGGATGTSTTKIFPAPTRPLKTKRDPKKLRMAGGQVWEDHSLGDWDPSESSAN